MKKEFTGPRSHKCSQTLTYNLSPSTVSICKVCNTQHNRVSATSRFCVFIFLYFDPILTYPYILTRSVYCHWKQYAANTGYSNDCILVLNCNLCEAQSVAVWLYEGWGYVKTQLACIIFIGLPTTCFGYCGLSSGHKNISIYIFVTWRWPTVAETCRRQHNEYDTRQLCFDVPNPLPNCL